MLRVALALIVSGWLGTVPTGCGRRGSGVERGIATNTLERGAGVDPATLDPQRNTGSPEGYILEALFDSLVYPKRDNVYELEAKGAERWTISPDGLVFDFFLRPDARWSNGDPVVAEDYRASFLRLLEPELASAAATFAYPIAGAEDYHRGNTRDPKSVGLEAPERLHFRIRLRKPMPQFVYLLDGYPFVAVHRPSIEANGGWLNPTSPWTKANVVSNGPYQLKAWRPGQEVIVERNPHYWNAAQIKLRAMRFLPIESLDTEERAYRAGQLHVTYALPVSRLASYRTPRSPELRMSGRLGVHYLVFNTEHGALTDPRVRRALAAAIDRKQLAEKVFAGGEQPAATLSQPGMGGYEPTVGPTDDANEARRLLAEAGFPGGAGFPVLSYLYNTSERNRDIAQALQQMWLRELGVRVELHNEEWKVFLDSRKTGNFDIARAGWLPFSPEASELFELFTSSSLSNDSKWKFPEYDQLWERAATTVDRAKRHQLYRELDKLFLEQMPGVPLAYYSSLRLVHPSVNGWLDNPRDRTFPELISLGRGQTP